MNTNTDTNNVPRKNGRPRGLPAKRVYVLKPGLKARTGNRKKEWTCAYLSGPQWAKFLALTGGDEHAITSALRNAALTLPATQANVSAAVRVKALKLLEEAYADAVALAAANNAAWEYGDANT